jgi:hypothetical protein
MFTTNEEAAELAYKRARISLLDSNGTESYSSSNYDVTDTALTNHPILTKLPSLAVILRDDKFS